MKRILCLIICVSSIVVTYAKSGPKLIVTMSETILQTGDVLYLSASLESSSWTIKNQKWFLDGNELAVNYGAPYKLEMQIGENLKPGEHTIKALAICMKGRKCINIAEERRIIVEKTNNPKSNNIFYLSPSNKSIIPGQTLNVWAFSKSKNYRLSYAKLYFGNQSIGVVRAQPFQFNINIGKTVRPGRYKIQAMVIGYLGTIVRTEHTVLYVDVKEP